MPGFVELGWLHLEFLQVTDLPSFHKMIVELPCLYISAHVEFLEHPIATLHVLALGRLLTKY